MKHRFKTTGSTLLVTILAIAIGLGVVSYTSQSLKTAKKENLAIERSLQEDFIVAQLQALLSSSTVCKNTFSSLSSVGTASSNTIIDVPVIKDAPYGAGVSVNFFDKNDLPADYEVRIKKVELSGLMDYGSVLTTSYNEPLGTGQVRPTDVLKIKRRMGFLKIYLDKKIEKNQNGIGYLVRSKVYQKTTPLIFEYVAKSPDLATFKLESCYSDIGGATGVIDPVAHATGFFCTSMGGILDQTSGNCSFKARNLNYCSFLLENIFQSCDPLNVAAPGCWSYSNTYANTMGALGTCVDDVENAGGVPNSVGGYQINPAKRPETKPFYSALSNDSILCEMDIKMVAARGEGLTKFCPVPIYGGCAKPPNFGGVLARGQYVGTIMVSGGGRSSNPWFIGGGAVVGYLLASNPIGLVVGAIIGALFRCGGKKTMMCTKCYGMEQANPNLRLYTETKKWKKLKCKTSTTWYGCN